MEEKYTLADVGCYVDGTRGIYAIDRIVEIAVAGGMVAPEPLDVQLYPDGVEDEATEYMNAHYAVEGAILGPIRYRRLGPYPNRGGAGRHRAIPFHRLYQCRGHRRRIAETPFGASAGDGRPALKR